MSNGLVRVQWGWVSMQETIHKWRYLVSLNVGDYRQIEPTWILNDLENLLQAESDDLYLTPSQVDHYLHAAGRVRQHEFNFGEIIL